MHGEEKREEGDRGGQEEKRGNQKGPVINSLCALHSLEHSERFMDLHRDEKREEGGRGDQEEKRRSQKGRDQSSQ